MPRLSFRVLGPIGAERAGEPLPLKGPRHRAVLARLLVAHGRMVTTDQLIDDLWEHPPQAAVGALQTFVAELRRLLEPDRAPRSLATVLVTAAPGYALRADRVDADDFGTAVGRAAELLATGDSADALTTLDDALALWHGPAYAEFAEQGWARAEIDRLDGLRQLAAEHRAAALIDLARPAEAVPGLHALLAAHPLREHGWQLLALALYRSGRQSDALAALRRVRGLLRTELGADPGPGLQQLEADILAHAPQLRPVPAAVRMPSPGTGFLGRATELDALRQAAETVQRQGLFRLVLLSGEAGAGKSALAEAISSMLAEDGWRVALGENPADTGVPPGWAWTRIRAALADRRSDPDLAASADETDPAPMESETDRSRPAFAGADPAEARFLFHRAAAAELAVVARRAPVLVVFDDLHNAGAETLDLLAALTTSRTAGPVLVLATYRSTEIGTELTALLGKVAPTEPVRIYLGGLSEADTVALVREIAGPEVADSYSSRIHRRSNGNPFFVRELARLLRDEGTTSFDAVPAGVRAVIRHRMAALPPATQTVVQQAAVLGADIDREILFEVFGDAESALDALDQAITVGLLTELPDGALRFTHELVRDTVYHEISGARRARWHGEIGSLLEKTDTTAVSVLAHHFIRAQSRATAASAAAYASAAARAAEQGFALAEAVRLWRAALAAFDRSPTPDLSAQLAATTGLARVLAVTGALDEARTFRRLAITRAEQRGDPALTAEILSAFDIPAVWTTNDDPELAGHIVAAAERALTGLPAERRELRARLCTTLALELRGTTDDRGVRAAAAAERIARELDDPALLAFALNGRFMHTFQRAGLSPERGRIGDELVALGGAHRLISFEVLGHLIALQSSCATADLRAAADHAAAADRLANEYELPMVGVFTEWFAALRTALTGSPAQAEAAYRAAAESLGGSGMPGVERGLLPLALCCLRLRHGLPIDPDATEQYGPYEPWIRPIALLDSGLRDEAATALLATPDAPHDLLYELRICLTARAALALGKETTMLRCYDQLLPAATELAGAGSGMVTLEPVAHYLANLATALGRPATEHQRQARVVAGRIQQQT
ncbi:AfsR/SARP family transcriptional regulator [Nocardia vulneris]|uniref:AfsR/SARP family transcriptional regulator n=1 Tax=Nocardia vulneris TaxID=1141657 RepID=UPI000AD95795|nr:AfsR/SARP family transcriptional regulator [Nocardia vulneris]